MNLTLTVPPVLAPTPSATPKEQFLFPPVPALVVIVTVVLAAKSATIKALLIQVIIVVVHPQNVVIMSVNKQVERLVARARMTAGLALFVVITTVTQRMVKLVGLVLAIVIRVQLCVETISVMGEQEKIAILVPLTVVLAQLCVVMPIAMLEQEKIAVIVPLIVMFAHLCVVIAIALVKLVVLVLQIVEIAQRIQRIQQVLGNFVVMEPVLPGKVVQTVLLTVESVQLLKSDFRFQEEGCTQEPPLELQFI